MTEEKLPWQWESSKTFYKAMWDEGEPVVVEGLECRRWTGGLKKLFDEVCPHGQYGRAKGNLEALNCVHVEQRGGGRGSPSVVLLIQDPESARENPVNFRKAMRQSDTSSTTGQLKIVFHRLDEIEKELVRLNREVQYLKGEQVRPEYYPSPDPRKEASVQLRSLVGLAERLEEEDA